MTVAVLVVVMEVVGTSANLFTRSKASVAKFDGGPTVSSVVILAAQSIDHHGSRYSHLRKITLRIGIPTFRPSSSSCKSLTGW